MVREFLEVCEFCEEINDLPEVVVDESEAEVEESESVISGKNHLYFEWVVPSLFLQCSNAHRRA